MAVWDRIENPIPLPGVVTPEWVRDLDDPEFDLLLLGHLLPRSAGAAGRRAWEQLWQVLADWPDLQEDAQEALTEFLTHSHEWLLTHPEDKRASRFHEQVGGRLRGLGPGKLDRRGQNPSLSQQLLAAIATHRSAVTEDGVPSQADIALWAHLDQVRRRR